MGSTATRISINAKLYVNLNTYVSPTWTEIDNVRDLALNLEMDEGDASIRAGGGFALYEPTLNKVSIDFNMNEDTTDTNGWAMVQAAYFARAAKELLINDRATGAGAQGLRVTVKFFKFAQGQKLNDVQTTDVNAKPCINVNAVPAWYTQ